VMDVRFVLFTPDAYAAFEQALNAAGPADQNDPARRYSGGKDT
jgi:O-acetyl-ADP-ribose deacetylase